MPIYNTAGRSRNPEPPADDWDEISVVLADEYLRVSPGEYLARSVRWRSNSSFGRRGLLFDFELYDAEERPLGIVPCYCNIPRYLTTRSKLGAWLALAGIRREPGRRLSLKPLRGQRWKVAVRDVETSHDKRTHAQPYSVVSRIVGRGFEPIVGRPHS